MNQKKEFIAKLASHLVVSKTTLTGEKLIDELNRHGHLTNRKATFSSGRGVYKLIHATYDHLVIEGRQPEADNVANGFTNANGHPAWDK